MKNKKTSRSGFTVIEILIILAIVIILASVILTSIHSARVKSQNLSTFYSLRGTADLSFACLGSRIDNARVYPYDASDSHNSLCVYNSGAGWMDYSGFSDWPDIAKNGWSAAAGNVWPADGFYWCDITKKYSSHPGPADLGNYDNTSIGGSNSSGDFCYMFKKGSDFIWCTQEGCKKEGF